MRVRPRRATGRVRPVQRLVDRKQMRQVVPVRVHELVDPLDSNGLAPRRLDHERRVVEAARMVDRAVASHRRRLQPHALRQDVLPELPDGDLVVVDAPRRRRRGSGRHRRRNDKRGDVLRDAARWKRPDRSLRQCPRAEAERQVQRRTARHPVLERAAPRHPDHRRPSLRRPFDRRAPGAGAHRRTRRSPPTSSSSPSGNGTKSNTARAAAQATQGHTPRATRRSPQHHD